MSTENTVNPVSGASLIQVTHNHFQPPNREAIRRARKALNEARTEIAALRMQATQAANQRAADTADIEGLRDEVARLRGYEQATQRAIEGRDQARRERDTAHTRIRVLSVAIISVGHAARAASEALPVIVSVALADAVELAGR